MATYSQWSAPDYLAFLSPSRVILFAPIEVTQATLISAMVAFMHLLFHRL